MLKVKQEYYDNCIKFLEQAFWYEMNCNVGTKSPDEAPFKDDLMKGATMYWAVNRRHTSWCGLLYDVAFPDKHPWKHNLSEKQKRILAETYKTNHYKTWTMKEYLFIFFVHRLTGSAMDYSLDAYGYGNSVLPYLAGSKDIDEMFTRFKAYPLPKYTSKGYQIAAFPKIPESKKSEYRLAGDHFICELVPELIDDMLDLFDKNPGKLFTQRELVNYMLDWNTSRGFKRFKFPYNNVVSDIAMLVPGYVDEFALVDLGPNAKEAFDIIIDFSDNPNKKAREQLYDELLMKISAELSFSASMVSIEDSVCVFVHWIENHIDITKHGHYKHLDLDKVFSNHTIIDYPRGRQKPMLELGVIDTFNGAGVVTGLKVLDRAGMTEDEYKRLVTDRYDLKN